MIKKSVVAFVLLLIFVNQHGRCALANKASSLLPSQISLQKTTNELTAHINFFTELFADNQEPLVKWFAASGKDVNSQLHSRALALQNSKNYTFLDEEARRDLVDIIAWLAHDGNQTKTYIASREAVRKKLDNMNRFFDTSSLLSLFDISNWFFDTGKKIANNQLPLQRALVKRIQTFPFQHVAEKLGSITLRGALVAFGQSGSLSTLAICWQALHLLGQGEPGLFDETFALDIQVDTFSFLEKTQYALIIAKELAELLHIFYVFFMQDCMESLDDDGADRSLFDMITSLLPQQQNSLIELVSIYDEVSQLPVEQVLNAMNNLVKNFLRVVDRLQSHSGMHLYPWLQSKWVTIPLTASIVVIKVIQYFFPLTGQNNGGIISSSKPEGYNTYGGHSSLQNMLHNTR